MGHVSQRERNHNETLRERFFYRQEYLLEPAKPGATLFYFKFIFKFSRFNWRQGCRIELEEIV